jgi:hypothetical protein
MSLYNDDNLQRKAALLSSAELLAELSLSGESFAIHDFFFLLLLDDSF